MSNFLGEDALGILVVKMQERLAGNQQDLAHSHDSNDPDDSLAASQPCKPQAKASDTKCEPSWPSSDSQPCTSASVRNRSAPQSILKVRPSPCEKRRTAKCGQCKSHDNLTANASSTGPTDGGATGMLSTSAIKWGIGLMKEGLQSFICPAAGEENAQQATSTCGAGGAAAAQQQDTDPYDSLLGPTQHSSHCPQSSSSTLPAPSPPPPPPQCLSQHTSHKMHHPQTASYQQQACRPLKMSPHSANESSLSDCSLGEDVPTTSNPTAKCHMARSPTQSFYGDREFDADSMTKQRSACGSTRPITRKCDANTSGYSLSDAKAAYGCNEQKYAYAIGGAGKTAYGLSDTGYNSLSDAAAMKPYGQCSGSGSGIGISEANSFSSTKAGGSLRACSPCTSHLSPSHSNMSRSSHNAYGSQRAYGSAVYPEYTDGQSRSCGARQVPANYCSEAKFRPRSKSCGAPYDSMSPMRSCGSQNSYNGNYSRRQLYPEEDYEHAMSYHGAREQSPSRGSVGSATYRSFDPPLVSTQRMRGDCSRVSFQQSNGTPGQHGCAATSRAPQRSRPPDALQCQLALVMAQAIQAQARGTRCNDATTGRCSSTTTSPCHSQYQSPCPAAATARTPPPTKRQCTTIKPPQPQPCSDTMDDSVMERLWQLQVDNLVRDQYFPGTIQDTINGSEDFEQLAAKVVALESKGAGNSQCPKIEPISLLEAFKLRIDFERNVVLDEIETTPESCDRAEPTLRNIEDHYCKRFHTELNEAIAALFKAEICMEQFEAEPETQKSPTFVMQMERTELKMPADLCAASTSAAAAAAPAHETKPTSTVYMGMTIPTDEVDECDAANDEAAEREYATVRLETQAERTLKPKD